MAAHRAEMDPARPGELLAGRYQLTAVIGRGGAGVVYEAIDRDLKTTVAVKVLPTALSTSEEQVTRFQRQAELGMRLRHPGIVRIVGHGRDGTRHYLVMERLRGQTLAAHLGQVGLLAPEAAAMLVRNLAIAVGAGHRMEIIHRDLKPANVFLTGPGNHGEHPVVKVLDFGAAKWLDHPIALTRSRQALGTIAYMSPEQARNPKRVDVRTDIYALGVILYECLAGTRPFVGQSAMDVLVKIMNDPAPPLDAGSIPEALIAVTNTAMARSPDQRYENAQALADALVF